MCFVAYLLGSSEPFNLATLQGTAVHNWTSTSELVDAAHQLHLQSGSPVSNAGHEPSVSLQVQLTLAAFLFATQSMFAHEQCVWLQSSSGLPAKQTAQVSPGSPAAGCSRGTPQRSLSSPDMSRFKFRLAPNKPPVHPVSSRTPLRQQSPLLAANLQPGVDNGVMFKNTSDRHNDQERLFHQLDRKLTLHAPKHQPHSPTQSQRSPPFPTSISMLSLSPKTQSTRAMGSAQAAASSRELTNGDMCHGRQSKMPVLDRHLQAVDDDDSSTSSESCQPSTPIRSEDTLLTRDQQDKALAENVFAAMYEQANVLLRNLHFERLNRRATSA